VIAIGTDWASSVFFCAVTTISSIWAKAGAASAVERSKAPRRAADRLVRTERIRIADMSGISPVCLFENRQNDFSREPEPGTITLI
jgi:hypothetical protein